MDKTIEDKVQQSDIISMSYSGERERERVYALLARRCLGARSTFIC